MFRQANSQTRCTEQEEMWRLDGRSEDELDIQYKQDENPTSAPQQIDSDDSENLPLSRSSPSKISPSEIHFSIGDKTTKIVYNKKNVARKWSRDKLIQIATRNQRQQQSTIPKTPKGVSKAKTKHSTPIANFNERAKQAAILNSKEQNSIRRNTTPLSDTDMSNRSFLIFNTPVPQPKSIKVYNVEADPHDERSYEVITSNDAQDFMETSSLSPKTQNKQSIFATTTLDNEAINDTNANTPDMTFAISTKRLT